jgi:DNA-binding LytR/AlgR family response regulator
VKVKGESKQYRISESDILFVEASGNYSKIVLENRDVTTPQKLSNLEEQLSKDLFIRIHRSYLVSRDKIKSIEGNQIDISGHPLPIGQTYKEQVKSMLEL